MEEELVSVLLPVFRADEEELRISIHSILSQTYSNLELLILFEDDGSRKCVDFLESLEDKRVQIIELPNGTGLPHSLNVGIELSNGGYIARMDADDISKADRFQKQIDYLKNNKDITVVGSRVKLINKSGETINAKGGWPYIEPNERFVRMVFGNAGIPHPTAIIRKRFLVEHCIRYNESIRGSEDYHLWVDICTNGGLIDQLEEELLFYRVSDNQASQRYSEKMKKWDFDVKKKVLDKIGMFCNEDYDALFDWREVDMAYPVECYYNLVMNIIKENERTRYFDTNTLRRVISYEWFYKAFLVRKHNKDGRLLRFRYVKNAVRFRDLPYVFRECAKLLK